MITLLHYHVLVYVVIACALKSIRLLIYVGSTVNGGRAPFRREVFLQRPFLGATRRPRCAVCRVLVYINVKGNFLIRGSPL